MRNIAFKTIIRKRKRTILMLIAISMLSAVCYASCTLIRDILIFANDDSQTYMGNTHYLVYQSENIDLSNHYIVNKEYDLGLKIIFNQQEISLNRLENSDVLPFVLIEGRLPKDENEIVVTSPSKKNLGDSIVLEINSKSYEFTVVGVYEESETCNNIFYVQLSGGNLFRYSIQDKHLQLNEDASGIAKLMNTTLNKIVINHPLISNTLLKQYFTNETFLLFIIIIVFIFCICLSIISLKNVYLISNDDYKKEVGIIKSVGATPKQIKLYFQIQLLLLSLIGNILGIVFGMVLIFYLLSLFADSLFLQISLWMICTPFSVLLTSIISCFIVYVTGIRYYRHLFLTNVMDDLKEENYQYPSPINSKSVNSSNFSWRMFLIYNARMRTQTKNVRESFLILLLIISLFCYVTFVNGVYKNSDTVDYDVIIRNTTYNGQYSKLNLDFVYSMYNEETNGQIGIDYITVERLADYRILTQPQYYKDGFYLNMKYNWLLNMFEGKDETGTKWCNLYHFPTLLDAVQIDRLKEYIGSGTMIDSLKNNEFVSITTTTFNIEDCPSTNFLVSMYAPIGIYPKNIDSLTKYVKEQNIKDQNLSILFTIPAQLRDEDTFYPYTELKRCYLPLENSDFIIAKSYTSLNNGNEFEGEEVIKIKLNNSSLVFDFQDRLDMLLQEHDAVGDYQYELCVKESEIMNFTIFTIDIFFYPFIMLLFIYCIFNISNVLKGNIYIKEKDLRIMKSVGMERKQLMKIIMYEYLEGYFNAAFIVSILLILCAYFSSFFSIGQILELNVHLISVIFFTVFALGPMILIPMCFINIYFTKIQ